MFSFYANGSHKDIVSTLALRATSYNEIKISFCWIGWPAITVNTYVVCCCWVVPAFG